MGAVVLISMAYYFAFANDQKIELSTNPEYLYSSEFIPQKVALNGIALGESVYRISETEIVERYDDVGWIHTAGGFSYRYASSTKKVVELRLSGDAMRDLGLASEREVIPRFGKPDRKETSFFGGTKYFYDDRGLMVTAFDEIGIHINILEI